MGANLSGRFRLNVVWRLNRQMPADGPLVFDGSAQFPILSIPMVKKKRSFGKTDFK